MAISENAASGTPQDFPDFDDAGLAARLRISVSTLRAWRCHDSERLLPPGVQVGRTWLYDKSVVERWLASRRESTPRVAIRQPAVPTKSSGKRRGKPSNAETAAAKALGVTVPVWRATQARDLASSVGDAKRRGNLCNAVPIIGDGQ